MLQFPYFEWTTISLGPITIQVWGMFVALGMLLSLAILSKRAKQFGMKPDMLFDIAMWMILGGFVGARLFHVFLYEPALYLANPIEMIKVWHGGLSSFGGFFGAAAGFFFFVKRKKVSLQKVYVLIEQLSFAALFGWMVGRVGCSMIHDHWGIPCNCPFAIKTSDGPRLDMAVLEIIGLLPLAIFFFLVRKSKKWIGKLFPIMFVYYGILRFCLDFFRATDISNADARYIGLTPAQYFAILMIAIGAWLLYRKKT